jgi:hypothetical protein
MTSRTFAAVLTALLAVPCSTQAEERVSVRSIRMHDQRAQQRFEGGDYQGAFEELSAAQQLFPAAERLLSMAACQQRLGRSEEAIALYQLFLEDADADDEHRDLARQRIESLRAELDATVEETGAREDGEETAAEPPERHRLSRAPFFSMIGVAGAAILGFAILGGITLGMHEEFLVTDPGTQFDRYHELQDNGRRMTVATNVLLGLACLSAAVAVVLAFFTDWGRRPAGASSSRPRRLGVVRLEPEL